jgi:hypothetical protein
MSESGTAPHNMATSTGRQVQREASKMVKKLKNAGSKVARLARRYRDSERKPRCNYLDVERHKLLKRKLSKAKRRSGDLCKKAGHLVVDALIQGLRQPFASNLEPDASLSYYSTTADNNLDVIIPASGSSPDVNNATTTNNHNINLTSNCPETDLAAIHQLVAYSSLLLTTNGETTHHSHPNIPSSGLNTFLDTECTSYDTPMNDDDPDVAWHDSRSASETSYNYNNDEEIPLEGTPFHIYNQETQLDSSVSVVDLPSQQHTTSAAVVQATTCLGQAEGILNYFNNAYLDMQCSFASELAGSTFVLYANPLENTLAVHGG